MRNVGRRPALYVGLVALGAVALLASACGGGEATPTPQPSPTRPPAPTAAPVATATPAAPAPAQPTAPPTAAPTRPAAPAPTATPAGAVATPALLPGKRGGTLTSRSLFQPTRWDTFDGFSDVHTLAPMLNNLTFVDPYGDGKTIVGDVAEGWQFSEGGKVISFALRRGIRFHDGSAMTSRDVAYNLDRAWKPRSPTMIYFKARFTAIQKIEVLDDYNLRLTLVDPSNIFFQALAQSSFQIYPASLPFPERLEDWKKSPIGSGPFRFKSISPGVKMEFARNEGYWKPGLPYLDGVQIIQMPPDAVVAAFRVGRLDASNLDTGAISNYIDTIVKATGFIYKPIVAGWYGVQFNQRAPWTDPRVREAIDLAIDRKAVLDTWLLGIGSIYAPPMMPTEIGGAWGRSIEEFRGRPGYRPERRNEDVARAKALLAQAGVDPGKLTVDAIGSNQLTIAMEASEATFRELGIRVRLAPLESGALSDRALKQDFDLYLPFTGTIQLDDPLDVPATYFRSDGSANYGKWSDPALDALFLEQDRTLDVGRRRQLIRQLEDRMMDLRWAVGVVWRQAYVGHQPWVKNFPLNLPFQFQQKFRHEQVWIDR